MQTTFAIWQVFRDLTAVGEVILWRIVEIVAGYAFIIRVRVTPSPGMPEAVEIEVLRGRVDRGEWVIFEFDPGWPYNNRDAKKGEVIDRDLISRETQAKRLRRFRVIASLVEPENHRRMLLERDGRPVQEAATRWKHARDYVYDLLKLHWVFGGIKNALLPRTFRCGGPGQQKPPAAKKRGRKRKDVATGHAPHREGINVTEDHKQLIARSFVEHWKPNFTVELLAKKIWNAGFASGQLNPDGTAAIVPKPVHERISREQIRYWILQLFGRAAVIKKDVSPQTYNLKVRGLGGSIRKHLWFPGQRFEIDSTVLDIYLVSVFDRRLLIGRPIVYFVIDAFSGLIAGFHISLRGPDAEGAKCACFNAFSRKDAFMKRLGLVGVWPSHHVSQFLVSDRGEMFAKAVHEAFDQSPTILQVLPKLRPDLKPSVERIFKVANDRIVHWMPGAVRARQKERGQRDVRLDACLNLPELWRIIGKFVMVHNATADKTNLAPPQARQDGLWEFTPLSLWQWGMENADGAPRELAQSELITRFLPEREVTVRRDGIFLGSVRYRSETCDRNLWTLIARSDGSHTERVRLDPSWQGGAYWLNPSTGRYEPFTRDDPTVLPSATAWDIEDRDAYQILTKRDRADRSDAIQASFDGEVQDIVEPAMAEARDARSGMPNSQVVAGIRENRSMERDAVESGVVPHANAAPPTPQVSERPDFLDQLDDADDDQRRAA